jgi:hypothetical protein
VIGVLIDIRSIKTSPCLRYKYVPAEYQLYAAIFTGMLRNCSPFLPISRIACFSCRLSAQKYFKLFEQA